MYNTHNITGYGRVKKITLRRIIIWSELIHKVPIKIIN